MKEKQYNDRLSSVSNISSCALDRIVPKSYGVFKQTTMVILKKIFFRSNSPLYGNFEEQLPTVGWPTVGCLSSDNWLIVGGQFSVLSDMTFLFFLCKCGLVSTRIT